MSSKHIEDGEIHSEEQEKELLDEERSTDEDESGDVKDMLRLLLKRVAKIEQKQDKPSK